MPALLGIDLGTTTITALALAPESDKILASATAANQAERTAATDRARGYSEWDARAIASSGLSCMRRVVEQLPQAGRDIAGIGITGQQHGVVLIDDALEPLGPFVNWQDRRSEDTYPGTSRTYTQEAATRLGLEAPQRTGCKLATGYLATTLFWMKEQGVLPASGRACFLTDYFGALLSGSRPVTDPTNAAASGVLDVARGDWAFDLVDRLGLPRQLFCEVRPSGTRLGGLRRETATMLGLAEGTPVFAGIGDNQASFLGTVANRADTILVNVGTGGQVAAHTDRFVYDPLLETRPFPQGGFLLVCAGLCGGRSYALLEGFYRSVGSELLKVSPGSLYQEMNRLAREAPRGADGLRCEPFFTGTRADPGLRASWAGMSATNFTPGHMTRALLEGMARAFHTGKEAIQQHLTTERRMLVGAGNGLRENSLLAHIVADDFGMPIQFPQHREEAAYGAALLAAVSSGVISDLTAAGRLIRYGTLET